MREIRKILFVSLTNIGDVILSLPALDLLRARFPSAEVTMLAGPRAVGLFTGNAAVSSFIPFDKHAPLSGKLRLFRRLRAQDFDLVVDLRDSLFGFLLGKIRMPLFPARVRAIHASERHCSKVLALFKEDGPYVRACKGSSIAIGQADKETVESLLRENSIVPGTRPAVLSPGARSGTKRWPKEHFAGLAERLVRRYGPVLLIGDDADRETTAYISRRVPGTVDLSGRTSLLQLAYLLSFSRFLVSNDSANMHLACYLDIPTVGIFGPTDDFRYGPWSRRSRLVTADIGCRPCRRALCPRGHILCLEEIGPEKVLAAVEDVLKEDPQDLKKP